MLHSNDTECRSQIDDVCSLRFDDLAGLPDPILPSIRSRRYSRNIVVHAGTLNIGDAQEIKKVFGSIEYRLNTRVLGSGCITKKIKGDSMERMERNECYNPEIGTYNQNQRLFWVLEPYVGLLLQMKTGSFACNAIRIRHAEYSGAMV